MKDTNHQIWWKKLKIWINKLKKKIWISFFFKPTYRTRPRWFHWWMIWSIVSIPVFFFFFFNKFFHKMEEEYFCNDSIRPILRYPGGGHGNPLQYWGFSRSLGSYTPWGCKESVTTKRLSTVHSTLMTNLNKDFENNYRLTAFMNTDVKTCQSTTTNQI